MNTNRLHKIFVLVLLLFLFSRCQPGVQASRNVSSPNGEITVTFMLSGGVPYYKVSRSGRDVLKASKLGFTFKDAPSLDQNLTMVGSQQSSFDETWVQPWGEAKEIRNHYNELRVQLEETTDAPRKMNLVFRVYDYGLGFRYELPEQENLKDFQIMDEETEFVLTGDHLAWWIPAYQHQRYEYLYKKSPISSIPNDSIRAVHTPLTMETADGLFLSIHEANLTDYASMTLAPSANNTLLCDLVPWSDGVKVKATTPHKTPWRTIQIADNPGDLITSYLILNLNEPNKLGDVSWVKPGKYVGIWWGMHIGKYTWASGAKHGATTENTKRYIDFAAKHGFPGVLIEGWNVGWDGDWTQNGKLFKFTTPYDDFDIKALSAYAAAKGVGIIGHHETGAAVHNYERQMDDAFNYYQKLGIHTVKTGYVGWGQGIERIDENGRVVGKEWHHGQYMVRHYRKVVEKAAEHRIMLDVHEPIKDTGIRRTYPNMMSREGARGQEYNAWSKDGGNPPEHTTILPFTRLLAGPMDFTPGIFDLLFEKARPNNRVSTTLAKQLALYVVLYSPLQMAADLPENYENQPAFQFIEDVPVDWQETRVLHARIGDYVTIARQDRNSEDWYVGSITDEQGRTLEAPLTFLDADRKYIAEIYADAADTDWKTNPLAIDITRALVDRTTRLRLRLAPGGGQAIRIRPATEEEVGRIPPYEF
ncbi:MAG: glycoside hydrolase family 97 protein [bacterium]